MTKTTVLPKGFEELNVWIEGWALPTENLRWDKRLSSTLPELINFHNAMESRIGEILEHCDEFELGKMPEETALLFSLALMLSEVATPVDRYKAVRVPHSFPEEKFFAGKHGDAAL